mmetsp:Transcript_32398/g.100251  ORF Transcript_32398/g.100251 Transcript_32398/m.100251 type:complete len:156 (+) Transcript_32398:269-736(+)
MMKFLDGWNRLEPDVLNWIPSPAFGETLPDADADRSAITQGSFKAPSVYAAGFGSNSGHAVCVALRVEVGASAQERTMLELTHCCGTMDYRETHVGALLAYGNPMINPNLIDTDTNSEAFVHDMTCLTCVKTRGAPNNLISAQVPDAQGHDRNLL